MTGFRPARNVRTPPAERAHRGRQDGRGHGETRAGTDRLVADRVDACRGDRSRRERLPHGWAHDRRRGALDRSRGPLPTRVQGLPPLPPAYHEELDAGLAALGLTLTAEAREAIDGHARLLLAWTVAINLTSIREPAAVARLHVLDSLAAVAILRARGISRVLDLGSGGGFPGLPLAVALPAERALLVDSVSKKAQFLRTAIEALGLERRVAVEPQRAEAVARFREDREAWPAVTARAVSSLAELIELGLPLVAPGGVLVAWKRDPIGDELEAARGALEALRAGPVEVHPVAVPGLEAHRLVVIPRAGAVETRFPREPAERRRRPLVATRPR